MKARSIWVGLLCSILAGALSCGGDTLYSANELFPFPPSHSWVMANDRGELTIFETLPVQSVGCEQGELVDLHITKNATDAYWNPGLINAEVHWVMRHDENGQWRAVASLIHWDNPDPTWNMGKDVSINYVPVTAGAYLVVPARLGEHQNSVVTGYAQWYLDRTEQTSTCLIGVEKGPLFRWTAKLYVEQVDTPVYSGPAVVNEEFEGCSSATQEKNDSHACAHEKWYFAPGVGLVEINSIWQNTIIRRITR
jgi:hypothetical protein